MKEEKPLEKYIQSKKKRSQLLYDVMQKFLDLPKDRWRKTGPEEMSSCILEALAERGKDPRDIIDYKADMGPYTLCVRLDRTPLPEDDIIYRAEIYHNENSVGEGLAFRFNSYEAMELFFKVDYIFRDVDGGAFDDQIFELNLDLEDLTSILLSINDNSRLN